MADKLSNANTSVHDENGNKKYVKPHLIVYGKVKDIVQGGGKSGANADSDPQSTRKRGTG